MKHGTLVSASPPDGLGLYSFWSGCDFGRVRNAGNTFTGFQLRYSIATQDVSVLHPWIHIPAYYAVDKYGP